MTQVDVTIKIKISEDIIEKTKQNKKEEKLQM